MFVDDMMKEQFRLRRHDYNRTRKLDFESVSNMFEEGKRHQSPPNSR